MLQDKTNLVEALTELEREREAEVLGELLETPSEEQVQEWIRIDDERKTVNIIYEGGHPWKYYLTDPFGVEDMETSEKEFFEVVGTDRGLVPMEYAEGNVNRQNFFLDDILIGYRVREG